jgi:hypothetical protein
MPEVIIIPIIFACLTYMVVSIARVIQRSRRDSHMAEVTTRLVDRMGSGPEVAAFLASEAYRAMLGPEPAQESNLQNRILNSVQAGVVFFAAGGALLGTANWIYFEKPRTVFAVIGVVLIAVGAALTLSALWSRWLVQRWNIESASERH